MGLGLGFKGLEIQGHKLSRPSYEPMPAAPDFELRLAQGVLIKYSRLLTLSNLV